MFNKTKVLTLLAFSFAPFAIFAQSLTSSPYSRFGLGELQKSNSVVNLGMGGISNGIRTEGAINSFNPASYNAITLTTFEVGASASFNKISNASDFVIKNSAAPNYLKIAFPISKRWGTSVGLLPYSGIGYESTIQNNNDSLTQIFRGEGGLNQFYLGNSYRIAKNLSIGLNISYVFGTVNKIRANEYADTLSFYNIRQTNSTYIGSLYANFGLQYIKNLTSGKVLTIGYSGALKSSLNASRNLISERYYYVSTDFERLVDTVQNTPNEKGKVILPSYHSFGFSYAKPNNWLVGVDLSTSLWSEYRDYGANPKLNNTYDFAIGGSIIPEYNAVGNYFKTIEYRLGFNYNKSYITINNQDINAMSLSVGFGLPLPKSSSKVNLAFELGQRGTKNNNLIQEQYFNVKLGFNFCDKWFIKRQYD